MNIVIFLYFFSPWSIVFAWFRISEVNTDGATEFIEVEYNSKTLDNSTDAYFLVLLAGAGEELYIDTSVQIDTGSSDRWETFCNNKVPKCSYSLQARENWYYRPKYWSLDILPNGDNVPTVILILKQSNETAEFRPSDHHRLKRIVTMEIARTVQKSVVDMWVIARNAKKVSCPVLDILQAGFSDSPYTVFREMDMSGHLDMSLNFCTEGTKSEVQLGSPTPGLSNNCSGVSYSIEPVLSKLNSSNTSGPNACFAERGPYPSPAEMVLARDSLLKAKILIDSLVQPNNSLNFTDLDKIYAVLQDQFGYSMFQGETDSGSGTPGGDRVLGGFIGGFVGFFGGLLSGLFGGLFGGLLGPKGGGGSSSKSQNKATQDSDKASDSDSNDEDSSSERVSSQSQDTTTESTTQKRKWCDIEDSDPIPMHAECFMKNCEKNKSPSICGDGNHGKLRRLSSLVDCPFEESHYHVGVDNIADLILSRGDGLFEWESLDLNNIYVCEKHIEELGIKWSTYLPKKRFKGNWKKICELPAIPGLNTHSKFAVASTHAVSKLHSQAIFKLANIFIPIGSPTCISHRRLLQQMAAEFVVRSKGHCLSPEPQTTLAAEPDRPSSQQTFKSQESDICNSQYSGSDYCPSEISKEATERKDKAMLDALHHFSRAAEISYLYATKSGSIKDLAPETLNRRVRAIRQMIKVVCRIVAEKDAAELEQLLINERSIWEVTSGTALDKILSAVAEAFLSSPTSNSKKAILSTVTSYVPLAGLQKYLPGLSPYYYRAARKFSAHFGIADYRNPRRLRYDPTKVEHFISFITSPHIIQDLPYGIAKLRRSDGSIEEIPNMIRTTINTHIVGQYIKYMESEGKTENLLSRSTMLRVLDICTASTRKSLSGLDTFMFELSEAFDALQKLIEKINSLFCDEHWKLKMKRALNDAKHYLKSDFKLHLKETSRIPDHCITYALSEPTDDRFVFIGSTHLHDLKCERCEGVKQFLTDIETKLEITPFSSDSDKANQQFLFNQAKQQIFRYKQHVIRTINQEMARTEIMARLRQTDVHIQMDFAMKFVPLSGRECMAGWFGKRGIGWHISVLHRKISGVVSTRTFVHILDQAAQDSNAVTAILTDLLGRLKLEFPQLRTAYIRSDNAGAYHSAGTLSSVSHISRQSGVNILRWDFSESQSGKGACDRAAALIKTKVRIFAAEGNRCTTAREFAACASSHDGNRAVTIINGIIETKRASTAKITGIKSYFNFLFGTSDIKAWKAYGIGAGATIPRHDWLANHNVASFISTEVYYQGVPESEVLPDTIHWNEISDRYTDDGACFQEQHNLAISVSSVSPDVRGGMFQCPEQGCIYSFKRAENLMKHLDLGDHIFKPERETLRDFAIGSYKKSLETFAFDPRLPQIQDALQSTLELADSSVSIDPVPEGWALHAPRKNTRWNSKQVNFVREFFERGIRTGQKSNPQAVAEAMMTAVKNGIKVFSSSEYLTWKQIQSFFSREASRSEQSNTQSPHDHEEEEEHVEQAFHEVETEIRCQFSRMDIDE